MHARSFAILALPLAVVATAVPRDGVSQCNVGTLQCCKQVQSSKAPGVGGLLGLLGVVLGPIEALVGFNCNTVNVIGITGNTCAAQPVCCTGNQFNGLVALGCSPVNVNI